MFSMKSIIKGNYLQYVRSYSFLLTIAFTLYVAFSFIPSPEATYSTMRFGKFSGVYNATWIASITAIMSSMVLSLFGFFLVNGSIKKDIETRIGHIISTTRISNFKYVLAKAISNFLILFSILIIIFLMSIALFFLYGNGHAFELVIFLKSFAFIALPSTAYIAILAVCLEVLFPRKRMLQYAVFFFSFFLLILFNPEKEASALSDPFGIQYPIHQIQQQFSTLTPEENTTLSVGFISGGRDASKLATITSFPFSSWYLAGRLFWVVFLLVVLYGTSYFFHRFNVKQKTPTKTKVSEYTKTEKGADFQLANITGTLEASYKITPLIFAESIMLLRKNASWVWGLTFIGMIASIFVPIAIAHQYILPLLWFLQITLWSDLITKDKTYRTHYFVAASYSPIHRLFFSRIIAGILLALFIALPLMLRLVFSLQVLAVLHICLGAIFIVNLAVFLGILSKSKKLFEVTFFFLTYSCLNMVPFTDYLGAIHTSFRYLMIMFILASGLFYASYFMKKLRYE